VIVTSLLSTTNQQTGFSFNSKTGLQNYYIFRVSIPVRIENDTKTHISNKKRNPGRLRFVQNLIEHWCGQLERGTAFMEKTKGFQL